MKEKSQCDSGAEESKYFQNTNLARKTHTNKGAQNWFTNPSILSTATKLSQDHNYSHLQRGSRMHHQLTKGSLRP